MHQRTLQGHKLIYRYRISQCTEYRIHKNIEFFKHKLRNADITSYNCQNHIFNLDGTAQEEAGEVGGVLYQTAAGTELRDQC